MSTAMQGIIMCSVFMIMFTSLAVYAIEDMRGKNIPKKAFNSIIVGYCLLLNYGFSQGLLYHFNAL